jgi:hypothetical protein
VKHKGEVTTGQGVDGQEQTQGGDGLRLDLLQATELRRQHGREHLAEALNWWFTRSGISHTQASALAEWTTGDHTALQTSQLSHLRNARLATPQLKLFEGLAALNRALACWQKRGSNWCIAGWGPVPKRLFGGAALEAGAFLWHPNHQGRQPLEFHDFCDIFAGFLQLDYVSESSWSPSKCHEISDALSDELDAWLARTGGIRAGMAMLKELYPHDNTAQLQKLQQVILGQSRYSPAELNQEHRSLAKLLCSTGIKPSNASLKSFMEKLGLEAVRPPDDKHQASPAETDQSTIRSTTLEKQHEGLGSP